MSVYSATPPASTDGSSAISEYQRISVISRDGGLCVLCGMDPVDVSQIVDRKSGDQGQVSWIRGVAPSFKQQRELLLEHEHRDFAMRKEILAQGDKDPGRTFPALIDEFEYIPVRGDPIRMHIHNPTPHDPIIFTFDNVDQQPCPLLHFRASHIALMVEAKSHLSSLARLQSPKGDVAEQQIATLLRLYRRQPVPYSNLTPSISVPSNYEAFCIQLEQPNTGPSAHISTTVPSSPPLMNTAPAHSISFANDDPMPHSSPASTDDSSETEDADADLYAGADIQLAEYAKERSITWEDLKNRPPLFGGEDLGLWRFASADDMCRSMGL